ncbi:MAG: hypothetical protein SWO11_01005 [Thermodesulfobacteriota bacterium]|nr:hypothetical protein [Thermodesulfobacteriota bacterium]
MPHEDRKDTTDDGLFDTIYYFKEGRLSSSTKETDGDHIDKHLADIPR